MLHSFFCRIPSILVIVSVVTLSFFRNNLLFKNLIVSLQQEIKPLMGNQPQGTELHLSFFLIFLKNFLFTDFFWGGNTLICCSIYQCIHWLLLIDTLTQHQIHNLGVLGQRSNQLSYLARSPSLFLKKQSQLLFFKNRMYIIIQTIFLSIRNSDNLKHQYLRKKLRQLKKKKESLKPKFVTIKTYQGLDGHLLYNLHSI